ncbi:MAG: hypothetical protein HW384_568, partial [Dehalococcoidia bacterium]|nr:hypothetical protein [Dehalococcoidia bacterium]
CDSVLDWWLTFAQTRLALVRTNTLSRRSHLNLHINYVYGDFFEFRRGDTGAVSLHLLVPTLCVGMNR